MFKVHSRNTKTRCQICSELTIKTPEGRHWRRSSVFAVNLEHISHLVLVFLLLTLSRQMPAGSVLDILAIFTRIYFFRDVFEYHFKVV